MNVSEWRHYPMFCREIHLPGEKGMQVDLVGNGPPLPKTLLIRCDAKALSSRK